MATTNDMPPPATKARTPKKQQSTDTAPDPNANRADDYPNRWRIERGKQTAKCMFCSHRLAGTQWCVACENCNRRMCSPCWEGHRTNRYGEAIFEGRVQNEEGCWCRFPGKFDPKWQPENDARTARMRVLMAAEQQANNIDLRSEDDTEIEEPVAKRQKVGDNGSVDLAMANDYSLLKRDTAAESYERSTVYKESPATDSVQQHTPATSPARNQRIKHLHNKTTVIVGAGVIGLAIARELASVAKGHDTNHKIIVVEKYRSYAGEASHHCAGLITKHGVPKGYEDLLKLSLDSWRQMLDFDEIREKLHYKPHGVFHVKTKTSEQKEGSAEILSPSWYEVRSQDALKEYGSDIGKM